MGVILMEHLYEGNKSMVIFIAVLSEVQNKLSTITMYIHWFIVEVQLPLSIVLVESALIKC